MTAAGYGVMKERLNLETIKQQIDDMQAVRANDVGKMVEKKWTIELGDVCIIFNKEWVKQNRSRRGLNGDALM